MKCFRLIKKRKLNYLIGERDKVSKEVIHTQKINYLLAKLHIKYLDITSNKIYFKYNLKKLQNYLQMLTNP